MLSTCWRDTGWVAAVGRVCTRPGPHLTLGQVRALPWLPLLQDPPTGGRPPAPGLQKSHSAWCAGAGCGCVGARMWGVACAGVCGLCGNRVRVCGVCGLGCGCGVQGARCGVWVWVWGVGMWGAGFTVWGPGVGCGVRGA